MGKQEIMFYDVCKTLNNKKIELFCDMDGVLAKWNPNASIEDTFVPGYFFAREVQMNVRDALVILAKSGIKVSILSAVYNEQAAEEKKNWLDLYALGDVEQIFVPCGANKADYITRDNDKIAILLDDYTKNLNKWRAESTKEYQYIGIKFFNGINGTKGTWDGPIIHHQMLAELIAWTIISFACRKYGM